MVLEISPWSSCHNLKFPSIISEDITWWCLLHLFYKYFCDICQLFNLRKLWLLSKCDFMFFFQMYICNLWINTWSESPAPRQNCKDLNRAKISALRKDYFSPHRIYYEFLCGEKFNRVKTIRLVFGMAGSRFHFSLEHQVQRSTEIQVDK